MMIADEIFNEMYAPKQTITLELSIQSAPALYEYEFEYESELDAVGKRLEACLKKIQIPGIKGTPSVSRSSDAEIQLEFDRETAQVLLNQRRGNRFRDSIGAALAKCQQMFSHIKVEGATGVNNRITTSAGPRFVDIRLKDNISGKTINVEIKSGNSRYHGSQRKKDDLLASGGKGATYVVRGFPTRRNR